MRKTCLAFGLFALASLTACGPRRYSAIEVAASDFDLQPLVGRWSGDYSGSQTGRTGTITFTLLAGEASASGEIVMIPRQPARSTVPLAQNLVGDAARGTVREVLTIHFVRKDGQKVVGMLDTYRDPDCACRVTTVFEGHFLDGRTIEGTFSTLAAESSEVRSGGIWKVTRVKRL